MSDVIENSYIFSSAASVSNISRVATAERSTVSAAHHGTAAGLRTSTRARHNTGKTGDVSKVYKRTTHYNNLDMHKKDIVCFDDSNACGEYFSLDLDIWEELSYSIDEHKRINVGRQRSGNEVRLFIKTSEFGEFKIVDNIILFSRSGWAELRRVRGKDKGLPLEVNANGTLWIGDRAEFNKIKIFTMKV